MASLNPYSPLLDSAPGTLARRRFRHRAAAADRQRSLLAITQIVGLAGAMAFVALFAVFAAASEPEPLGRALVVGLLLLPFSLLVYFMRQAAGALNGRVERRSSERAIRLVIDA